jgi:hypothetical protein
MPDYLQEGRDALTVRRAGWFSTRDIHRVLQRSTIKRLLKIGFRAFITDPANEGSLQTPGDTLKSPIASLVSR